MMNMCLGREHMMGVYVTHPTLYINIQSGMLSGEASLETMFIPGPD